MTGVNKSKKVDHKVMSEERCLDCGDKMKQNKVAKKHKYCYPCFKLRNGQPYAYQYQFIDNIKTLVIDKTTEKPKIRRDFRQEQKENRIKNGWGK